MHFVYLIRHQLIRLCAVGTHCRSATLIASVLLSSAVGLAVPYTFSTVAGSSTGYGAVDATGSAARFSYGMTGIAADLSGIVYVADNYNRTIRKVTPAGVVTTFAGTNGSQGNLDATGTTARFAAPWGVVRDSQGNLFVTDGMNHTIRKITPGGAVTTFAGPGPWNYADGIGAAASFGDPKGIAIDSADNLYVCDTGYSTIRKITPAAVVTTFAGPGAAGGWGSANGIGTAARFAAPRGLTTDNQGNVYVADSNNHTIRMITPAGVVTTFAGLAGVSGSAEGVGGAARFYLPFGISSDPWGNLMIADTYNNTIRSITPGKAVTTVGGLAGSYQFANGTGSNARFKAPIAIYQNSANVLSIADTDNFIVRIGTPSVSTQMPTISSALTVSNPANSPFNYQITASNNPTAYAATGLPAGLSVNASTGLISGTPTVIGTAFANISATNAFGTGGIVLTIAIAGAPPMISSATALTVTVSELFNYQIVASNSPTTYNFNNVPPGSGSYSPTTGLLNIVVVTPGIYNMQISASNNGGTAQATVIVTVLSAPPVINLIEPVGAVQL